MKKVAIIGAGAMGSGIAQVAAMSGCEVILYDSFAASIVKARDSILSSLNKLVEKNKFSDAEAKAIFGRIYFAEHLDSIAGCDLILEAIVEDESEKKNLFTKISSWIKADTIVASNTSSLSITALAHHVPFPENFIGIHFFNPPVLMQLVEVIPSLQTASSVLEKIVREIKNWNKVAVIAKDTPGFLVNRIARPYYGEAIRIVEEKLAFPEEVDASMKTFGGFRMGPFELMDFIGHDVNYAVTNSVWKAMFFDPRYKPSHTQTALVHAGWLGKKSGKGFYDYGDPTKSISGKSIEQHRFIFERIFAMLAS